MATSGIKCAEFGRENAYELKVHDFEYRVDEKAGPMLARIYQPQGEGPFALIVDIHGGAWHGSGPGFGLDRNWVMARNLAARGAVLASLDFRTGKSAPFPADLQDINCAIRMLKANADKFNIQNKIVGAFGSSSGAQEVLLAAMLPDRADFTKFKLPSDDAIDASLDFVIASCPPVNLLTHLKNLEGEYHRLLAQTVAFFGSNPETASPYHILTSGGATKLPPLLVLHGSEDKACPFEEAMGFVREYVNRGGNPEMFCVREGHLWYVPRLAPDSEVLWNGHAAVVAFIQRQIERKRHPYEPIDRGYKDMVWDF